MAVNSEFNWLGQQRVDLPHLKLIESAVRYDFDALAYMIVGETPQIVRGFDLIFGGVGVEASRITIKTAGAKVIHNLASDSGSIFSVPSTRALEILDPSTNTRMEGSFSPDTTNYVSIDLRRTVDSSTSDLVQFLSPSTNTESGQKVPLRRTLDYKFIIRKTDFSFDLSLLPILIVTTNKLNVITAIKDARPLLGRLNPGSTYTSDIATYGWPGGRPNVESAATSSISGDKALTGLKPWMNAVMHRLHEIGGGQYWYSLAADRNVNLHTGRTVFASTGESFEIDSGHLHWQGLSFGFDNSPQYTLTIDDQTTDQAGLTDLANGECVYCDLDRTTASTVALQKGTLTSLGGSLRPGQRWVVCSRIGDKYYVNGVPWPIGTSWSLATTVHAGAIRTNLDFDPVDPVAATIIVSVDATRKGIVTGAGLSHNRDYGSARLYDANGDIRIGRGNAAGDDNVIIRTDQATKGTFVYGAGTFVPYFTVDPEIGTDAPPNVAVVSFNEGNAILEGNRSWSTNTIVYLPLPPITTVSSSVSQVKYFMKQNKTWKTPVKYMATSLRGYDWTWDNDEKTLTRTTSGVIQFDANNVPDIGDRVAMNVAGFDYNGIYVVTDPGGGTNPVLTLARDFGGPGSVQEAGSAYDVFDGVAFKITDGNNLGGMFAVLDAPKVAGAIDMSVYTFKVTDSKTMDQLCVMYPDGTYTVVSSGPEYDAGVV